MKDQLILSFEVGGVRYGLPAEGVARLVRAVAVAPLPKAPAVVEGVVNVHGELVPVLDLRARFNLPPKPVEPSDRFVLALAGDRPVAVRADAVAGLVHVDATAPDDIVVGTRHLAGVGRLPDGVVLIADLGAFLSQAEDEALEEALS